LDLRRKEFHGNKLIDNKRDISNYIFFDLKDKSYLEPITTVENKFRVTDYNPERLAESHSNGKHKYCIAKEVFEADYIIALPKAKTHQKTGITNAIKLLVGFNAIRTFYHITESVEQVLEVIAIPERIIYLDYQNIF